MREKMGSKTDFNEHLESAQFFYKQGNITKACESLQTILNQDPNYIKAHQGLSQIWMQQHRYQRALHHYQALFDLGAVKSVEPYLILSALFSQLRRDHEAEEVCLQALQLFPQNASRIYQELGHIYTKYHHFSKSQQAYEKSWRLNPENYEAYFPYAHLHTFQSGDALITHTEQALQRDDINGITRAKLLFTLGKANRDLENFETAFNTYAAANKIMAHEFPFISTEHHKVIKRIMSLYGKKIEPPTEVLPSASHEPIFIIGMSRSGKTLVERILSAHPDVLGAGEGNEWDTAILTFLSTKGSKNLLNLMLTAEDKRRIGDNFMELVRENCPPFEKIIHSSNNGYWYLGLILQIFPQAKIIFCSRNPLDNCWAAFCKYYHTNHGYAYNFDTLALFYEDYHMIMQHWLNLYGERILKIDYEGLVQNPETVIPKIFKYCELEPTSLPLEFLNTKEINHWLPFKSHLQPLCEKFK